MIDEPLALLAEAFGQDPEAALPPVVGDVVAAPEALVHPAVAALGAPEPVTVAQAYWA